MKILFVQPYVSFGGVFSDTLAGHLARKGHDVEIVSYVRKKEDLRIFSEDDGVRFHPIDALSVSIPNFVTEFPYFLFLERRIKEIQPDLIHINNLPFLTTPQSAKIAKKLGIGSVLQVHGVRGERGFFLNSIQKAYLLTFGPSLFNSINRVFCLTDSDALIIARYGCSKEKIRIVVNGVDVDKFYPSGEEIPDSLLWCGRFVKQKGLEYLIEAIRIIVKERGKVTIKLRMTGDGPLLPKIRQMVKRYGLENNVLFMGVLPRKDLPSIMARASLYLLPSINEGMPYVLLEAMACGKTVIGSNIPGIKDVINHGETGFLTPPRDFEALANAISQLLRDENLRRKLSHNARQLMIQKYQWDKVIMDVEKVYCEARNN